MPSLPVFTPLPSSGESAGSLGERLKQTDVGQVRMGLHDRLLYATDASLYQVEPLGVVIPDSADQIQRLLEFCRREKISLLPRGGGTSLAGQCTGSGLVMDLSPAFRKVWDIDPLQRRCRAQAGVVLDQLNRELRSHHTSVSSHLIRRLQRKRRLADALAITPRARDPSVMDGRAKM